MLDEGISLEDMGQRIFDRLLEVASGSPTKSEAQGMGDNEFIPWAIGATM